MKDYILLIDDNEINLELLSYLLTEFGYAVRTAESGAKGLAVVRMSPPNLILCDLMMPDMDGYEVARKLKSDPLLATIPVVAVSALAMAGDRTTALESGFDGYISKPIDPERFVREIAAYLAKPAPDLASQSDRNAAPASVCRGRDAPRLGPGGTAADAENPPPGTAP
jgi:two-component system, cell cycle response regulator